MPQHRVRGDISSSEITDECLFYQRRKFLRAIPLALLAGLSSRSLLANASSDSGKCDSVTIQSNEKLTRLYDITHYNNYYEFSTNKEAVAHLAEGFTTHPWTLHLEGEVEKPLVLDIDSIRSRFTQEERVYRLRCVEGWSMVIPWQGFSLCKLLSLVAPTSRAKYVEFVSVLRPDEMIGQRQKSLPWPYREGLRMDEAMHPLTMIATGLYGKDMPPQNGAPLRLVVPWKYGFKSAKAITHIYLREKPPATSWNLAASSEYGFYANVNPAVSHPRWSQARENRIGELSKRHTLPFNGYADQVAHLYSGMDLKQYF